LGDEEKAPTIGAVGDHAAEKAEGEPGEGARKTDEAEIKGARCGTPSLMAS